MKSIRFFAVLMSAVVSLGAQAAPLVFNSFIDDVLAGNIVKTDSFKCLLTTAAYVENRDTHTRRSDVTNEVSGAGYTAGGAASTLTVTKDLANDRVTVTLGAQVYASSTLTARKQVCYKSRGGAATADELVFVNDFLVDKVSAAQTFTINASTLHLITP